MGAKKNGRFEARFTALREEMEKVIVGCRDVIEELMTCLFSGGNALIESPPGLGKTLIVKTLSEALDLHFSRIQFTPDLMPADIVGTNVIMQDDMGKRYFEFQHGPVFTHILLADEINRATPKTQSALLEAMQEHAVTVGGVRYELEEPFIVVATENHLETEGTYSLPEAQIDRFFFNSRLRSPGLEELREIGRRTTTTFSYTVKEQLNREEVEEMKREARGVEVESDVRRYASRIVLATHPTHETATDTVRRFVRYGSSPRGTQALTIGGKVRALLDGRKSVSPEDMRSVAKPSLRHRLILNFEGEAENIDPDDIIDEVIKQTPESGA
ncbi:MAG: AAA family ATPase [Planctomycetes bacterium DG_58]|nr:MAG: AAA family ATPase [Planctomycetes bacterium DG_58]KPL01411.1 MAG: AAA family ATPase [Planctomycetes bacterium SM23_65]